MNTWLSLWLSVCLPERDRYARMCASKRTHTHAHHKHPHLPQPAPKRQQTQLGKQTQADPGQTTRLEKENKENKGNRASQASCLPLRTGSRSKMIWADESRLDWAWFDRKIWATATGIPRWEKLKENKLNKGGIKGGWGTRETKISSFILFSYLYSEFGVIIMFIVIILSVLSLLI